MVSIALVDSSRSPLSLKQYSFTLHQLTESLASYEVGGKEGEAFIPALFRPCPSVCSNSGRSKVQCGGGRNHRLGANVVSLGGICVDLDHLNPGDLASFTEIWTQHGLTFFWWETFSHTPEAPRARVFFPFSEPLPIERPHQWSEGAWGQLVAHLGLDGEAAADRTCRDPARLYYAPRKPTLEAARAAGHYIGTCLDWHPIVTLPPAQSTAALLTPAYEGDIDAGAVRELLKGLQSNRFAAAVIAGEPPVKPLKQRGAGDTDSHEAWRSATSAISLRLERHDEEMTEFVLDEFIRPAYAEALAADPEYCKAWEEIERLMWSAMESAPQKKAELKALDDRRKADRLVVEQRVLELRKRPFESSGVAIRCVGPLASELERESHPLRSLFTDTRNAERFRDLFRDKARHVADQGRWYVYNGTLWEEGQDAAVCLAVESVRTMYFEIEEMELDPKVKGNVKGPRAQALMHAKASEQRRGLRDCLEVAKSTPPLAIKVDAFDADPLLFNTVNGTVDLRTGEMRAHRAGDLLTKCSEVVYSSAAQCPLWRAFLQQVVPDDEVRSFLQKAVGYSLTGDVTEQVFFFLHGGGSNGKSTFITTIQRLLGDYATQGAADMLLAKHNEGHPAEVAALRGARMVVCSEVDEDRRFAESKVKQLTGGDQISARFMGQNFFTFTPTHKIWLSANHKPAVTGTDDAIWRRLRVIPFEVKISEEQKDKTLPARLKAEMPGILAWAVEGCMRWQREGLGLPMKVEERVAVYRKTEDILSAFIEEECTVSPSSYCAKGLLYKAFVEWCDAAGEHACSAKGLVGKLIERGFEARHEGRTREWRGIALRARSFAQPASKDFKPQEGKA